MKNPEFNSVYAEECRARGVPTLRALEILARTSDRNRMKKEAEQLFKKRQFQERDAQAAAQRRLAHKEEA